MYKLKSFANGFEYIEVQNTASSAKIALQGAHIFEYKREREEDILWLSQESDFQKTKAIRGGVPLCWPRFGSLDKSLPQHGFARTMLFELLEVKEIHEGKTQLILELRDTKESREIWDFSFKLQMKITIAKSLTMQLTTTNLDTKEMFLTQAFHTYFNVSDISDVTIKGLQNRHYFDALVDEEFTQNAEIRFTQEVDRVYQGVNAAVVLEDKRRSISIKSSGSSSVVVWNPWIEKCKRMSGMQALAYKEFVCIESANAFDDFKSLKAGESHRLETLIC